MRLIPAQFVKPFVNSNKYDFVPEAVTRQTRFMPGLAHSPTDTFREKFDGVFIGQRGRPLAVYPDDPTILVGDRLPCSA